MKKKIAKRIVRIAEQVAYWNIGKSILIGTYEITPPKELVNKKKGSKE